MFCVITQVPDPDTDGGNLAAALTYVPKDSELSAEQARQLRFSALLHLRTPVFTLGEILVLDGNDRDYGTTRKPSKWFIEYECCDTVEEAIAISGRVTSEAEAA